VDAAPLPATHARTIPVESKNAPVEKCEHLDTVSATTWTNKRDTVGGSNRVWIAWRARWFLQRLFHIHYTTSAAACVRWMHGKQGADWQRKQPSYCKRL